MTTYPTPICMHCVHQEKDGVGPLKCKAFPDGVPGPIWKSEVGHSEPYPGDHGIQYEQGVPAWEPEQ